LFYSFKESLYSEEQFLSKRKNILKNPRFLKKVKELYPKKKFSQVLELLKIDVSISYACKNLVFDNQLLKVMFLKQLPKNID
jgi:hypothetical protein